MIRSMLVVCLLVLVTATASDTDNDIVDIGEEPVTEELVWFTDRQAAEKQANEDGKSLMYLITEDWCEMCKRLESSLESSIQFKHIASENLILVKLQNYEMEKMKKFTTDGGYVPRIFFAKKPKKMMHSITNGDGKPQFKYFYYTTEQVIQSIEKLLDVRLMAEEDEKL